MKVTVLHDEHGRIISMSKPYLKHAGSKFEGQLILDIELASEQAKMPLLDLHKLYHLDRVKSILVKA
jgi:hypothetical protein